MAYPYPPHLATFSYVGKYRYFLTFGTYDRRPHFMCDEKVASVRSQILRAQNEEQFSFAAYCFMPDHVHILAEGVSDGSDLKRFVRAAKQYSGYHFKQRYRESLWGRYSYEHVLRDDIERGTTIRYILDNPVEAGLSKRPEDYPFLGSDCYTVQELMQQAVPRYLVPTSGQGCFAEGTSA